ncbi:MAG: hypothetical protein KBC64_02275 [Simkaniaceae bacterium]|nr:hypothetical protein [Simkaniaceae bacterium]
MIPSFDPKQSYDQFVSHCFDPGVLEAPFELITQLSVQAAAPSDFTAQLLSLVARTKELSELPPLLYRLALRTAQISPSPLFPFSPLPEVREWLSSHLPFQHKVMEKIDEIRNAILTHTPVSETPLDSVPVNILYDFLSLRLSLEECFSIPAVNAAYLHLLNESLLYPPSFAARPSDGTVDESLLGGFYIKQRLLNPTLPWNPLYPLLLTIAFHRASFRAISDDDYSSREKLSHWLDTVSSRFKEEMYVSIGTTLTFLSNQIESPDCKYLLISLLIEHHPSLFEKPISIPPIDFDAFKTPSLEAFYSTHIRAPYDSEKTQMQMIKRSIETTLHLPENRDILSVAKKFQFCLNEHLSTIQHLETADNELIWMSFLEKGITVTTQALLMQALIHANLIQEASKTINFINEEAYSILPVWIVEKGYQDALGNFLKEVAFPYFLDKPDPSGRIATTFYFLLTATLAWSEHSVAPQKIRPIAQAISPTRVSTSTSLLLHTFETFCTEAVKKGFHTKGIPAANLMLNALFDLPANQGNRSYLHKVAVPAFLDHIRPFVTIESSFPKSAEILGRNYLNYLEAHPDNTLVLLTALSNSALIEKITEDLPGIGLTPDGIPSLLSWIKVHRYEARVGAFLNLLVFPLITDEPTTGPFLFPELHFLITKSLAFVDPTFLKKSALKNAISKESAAGAGSPLPTQLPIPIMTPQTAPRTHLPSLKAPSFDAFCDDVITFFHLPVRNRFHKSAQILNEILHYPENQKGLQRVDELLPSLQTNLSDLLSLQELDNRDIWEIFRITPHPMTTTLLLLSLIHAGLIQNISAEIDLRSTDKDSTIPIWIISKKHQDTLGIFLKEICFPYISGSDPYLTIRMYFLVISVIAWSAPSDVLRKLECDIPLSSFFGGISAGAGGPPSSLTTPLQPSLEHLTFQQFLSTATHLHFPSTEEALDLILSLPENRNGSLMLTSIIEKQLPNFFRSSPKEALPLELGTLCIETKWAPNRIIPFFAALKYSHLDQEINKKFPRIHASILDYNLAIDWIKTQKYESRIGAFFSELVFPLLSNPSVNKPTLLPELRFLIASALAWVNPLALPYSTLPPSRPSPSQPPVSSSPPMNPAVRDAVDAINNQSTSFFDPKDYPRNQVSSFLADFGPNPMEHDLSFRFTTLINFLFSACKKSLNQTDPTTWDRLCSSIYEPHPQFEGRIPLELIRVSDLRARHEFGFSRFFDQEGKLTMYHGTSSPDFVSAAREQARNPGEKFIAIVKQEHKYWCGEAFYTGTEKLASQYGSIGLLECKFTPPTEDSLIGWQAKPQDFMKIISIFGDLLLASLDKLTHYASIEGTSVQLASFLSGISRDQIHNAGFPVVSELSLWAICFKEYQIGEPAFMYYSNHSGIRDPSLQVVAWIPKDSMGRREREEFISI